MTIEEMLDFHNVELAYFDNDLWPRPGIYVDEIKVVFVNRALSETSKRKVIFHELGHLEHDSNQYGRRHEEFELEANRYMIRCLLEDEFDRVEDKYEFNYLSFMKRHNLKTITDEVMVISEYYNLLDAV
ncbi:ImmA/IrrE family metallo-endopeptidase [Streptococcus pyogenes]|uniref:ImmA/IrrE family metallo-endopeptidase n=1 Tax=Streptococcus pyogenes TaxID=1314 RepID=UPI0001E107AA|nr:ImmA/IrrE family metallo-endopeptidase [Streptococcus pyogenes]EFM33987.1 putative toxin-antitoxin system, toxin component [Streptococcus pyogenes ATCC 10782]SQE38124.1 peptidase [Streptococcus pyogenes]SQF46504.1 peptidase [Streptococcus pyogenes]SUO54043.1 peptidase [Streptococcus pyogenes]SUO72298.1 peptidase [Streptococcus pyogenes]